MENLMKIGLNFPQLISQKYETQQNRNFTTL